MRGGEESVQVDGCTELSDGQHVKDSASNIINDDKCDGSRGGFAGGSAHAPTGAVRVQDVQCAQVMQCGNITRQNRRTRAVLLSLPNQRQGRDRRNVPRMLRPILDCVCNGDRISFHFWVAAILVVGNLTS